MLALSLLGFILLGLAGAAILAFEIWMFIDCINNSHISNERRIWWLIGMLIFHPVVAVAYYFTDRQLRS